MARMEGKTETDAERNKRLKDTETHIETEGQWQAQKDTETVT